MCVFFLFVFWGWEVQLLFKTNLLVLKYIPNCSIWPSNIYSNKKETSNFHGTLSFDPVKMSYKASDIATKIVSL